MIKVPALPGSNGEVVSMDVSRDNKWLFTGDSKGECHVWLVDLLVNKCLIDTPSTLDFDSLKPVHTWRQEEYDGCEVVCVRFANCHDSEAVVVYEEGSVFKVQISDRGEVGSPKLLFKHSHRITEVSWALDDEVLLLGSVNNEILIYDIRFEMQLKVLQIHQDGAVIQGLKFDKYNGKYLCSLADDRVINIVSYDLLWDKISDSPIPKRLFKWDIHQKLNKLITNNSLDSHRNVRRLDWSHDDKLISIPNANKGKMSLVNVLFSSSSGNWKNWCSLVGHNFNCEVTRFNPNSFVNPAAQTNLTNPQQYQDYYIIATAGSDKTLAIWNTSIDSPIVVAKDISTQSVSNMCWSNDGSSLFISAEELLVFCFDKEELGTKRDIKPKLSTRNWDQEYQSLKLKSSQEAEPVESAEQAEVKPIQQVTTVKNGKKRVLPISLSTEVPEQEKRLKPTTVSTSMEFDSPSYLVSKDISNQLKRRTEESDERKKKFKKELQPIEFIGSVVINPSSSFSNVRLSIPKIRKSWEHESPNDEFLYLSVKNGNGNESGPSKVQLFRKNQFSQTSEDPQREIFLDFVPKKVLLTTGGEGLFWALATIDGIIIVYSDTGKRILPPIVLGTPLSFLESKNDYLMAITCLGEIYAWNIKEKKLVFEPTSLFPLLQPLIKPSMNKSGHEEEDKNEQDLFENDILARLENLTLCSITSQGVPIITLSNGNGYLYDKEMCSWSVVSDSWWAFGSQYWDNSLIGGGLKEKNSNVVSMLEKHTNEEIIRKGKNRFFNKISKIMLMKEGFENLENIISINHLENKILIYKFLKDDKNFKYFLMVYVKKLIEMNFTNRIQDLILILKEEGSMNEPIIKEIVMLSPKLYDFVNSV